MADEAFSPDIGTAQGGVWRFLLDGEEGLNSGWLSPLITDCWSKSYADSELEISDWLKLPHVQGPAKKKWLLYSCKQYV